MPRDERLSHYRLENGKVLITQCLGIRTVASKRRIWTEATICLTEKQLRRLARRYLAGKNSEGFAA